MIQSRAVSIRLVLLVAGAALVLLLAAAIGAGEWLIRPAPRNVGAPPPDLPVQTVRLPLPGAAGGQLVAWFAPGQPGRGAVLLLHGNGSNRRQMLGRARWLQSLGVAVLLPDLPAHGESSGSHVGFGLREAAGAGVALDFLRGNLPGERIGAIGVSLGAAAIVMSGARPRPDVLVLESMYPTLRDAAANRLAERFGPPGRWLTPLLLWQLPWRLGFAADELRPVDVMPTLGTAVLLASGNVDFKTTPADTVRLFQASTAPRQMWLVEGAGHADLFAHDTAAYQARVWPFLQQHLQRSP